MSRCNSASSCKQVFDDWVIQDVGRVFVQVFDVALESWYGVPQSLCVFAPKCGSALAVEHNGDVYSCDHFVYPDNKLGNIMQKSFVEPGGLAAANAFWQCKGNWPSLRLP